MFAARSHAKEIVSNALNVRDLNATAAFSTPASSGKRAGEYCGDGCAGSATGDLTKKEKHNDT
jgi:hypothetical protein